MSPIQETPHTAEQETGVAVTLRLTSGAFGEGGTIPRQHTCEGQDIAPALEWSGLPAGTRSLARACFRRSSLRSTRRCMDFR